MPLSEEHKERMRAGRERNEKLREAGLLAPRKNKAGTARAARLAAKHEAAVLAAAATETAVNLADTPEFQAAVAEQVRRQIEALVPTIAGMLPASAGNNADRTEETLAKLAMMIAELTDQGSQAPKRIPPEILLARKAAHDRMIKLIVREQRAVERDPRHEPPIFHLTSKIIARLDDAGEQLIEPLWRGADNRTYPTELGWLDIPNMAMEPQNESAHAIMDAFLESIGNKPATSFKMRDEEPEPDSGIARGFALTAEGHVVTGGSATLMRDVVHDRTGPAYQKGPGVILNKGASLRQQHGIAPYKDVRVLGSIAPPARQNG